MNREIKFRCWDTVLKRMYPIAFPTWNGSVETRDGDYTHSTFFLSQNGPEEQGILLKYTGLKDKKNTEICEDDIVCVNVARHYNSDGDEVDTDHDYYAIVKYTPSRGVYGKVFRIKNNLDDGVDEGCDYKTVTLSSYRTEVIGNIYENPELLEDKQ